MKESESSSLIEYFIAMLNIGPPPPRDAALERAYRETHPHDPDEEDY
jgi:hypothetical protein